MLLSSVQRWNDSFVPEPNYLHLRKMLIQSHIRTGWDETLFSGFLQRAVEAASIWWAVTSCPTVKPHQGQLFMPNLLSNQHAEETQSCLVQWDLGTWIYYSVNSWLLLLVRIFPPLGVQKSALPRRREEWKAVVSVWIGPIRSDLRLHMCWVCRSSMLG